MVNKHPERTNQSRKNKIPKKKHTNTQTQTDTFKLPELKKKEKSLFLIIIKSNMAGCKRPCDVDDEFILTRREVEIATGRGKCPLNKHPSQKDLRLRDSVLMCVCVFLCVCVCL